MLTQRELELIKQYEWEKLTRRYPAITSTSLWARIMMVFAHKGKTQHLLWENGFLRGWTVALEQFKKEQANEET